MLKIARKLAGVEGAEIAEVALVLPVVFTLLLGSVYFGRAFHIYSTITQAAQQGAVAAARPTCATCPSTGWSGTTFPDDTAVENSVLAVMDASHLDRTQIIPFTPAGLQACPQPVPPIPAPPPMDCPHATSNNITICRSVWLNPSVSADPPPPQCGTVVAFQYPFQFNVPFTSLGLQPTVMKAEARSRMEN